jgi:hypothetical protein
MKDVKIKDATHSVHEEVYQWMKDSRDIINKTRAVREAQNNYFRTRTQSDLNKSKALERELDNLLAGKTPEKVSQQLELLR